MDAEPSGSSCLMGRPALSPGEAQPPSWGQVCVLHIAAKAAGSKQPAVTLRNGVGGVGWGGAGWRARCERDALCPPRGRGPVLETGQDRLRG